MERDEDRDAHQRALKAQLPVVAWSVGEYFDGQKSVEFVASHSGLVCIDIDHIPQGPLNRCKDTLAEVEGVILVFTSPRGDGLKVVFAFKNEILLDFHEQAYAQCDLLTRAELKLLGLHLQNKVDPQNTNLNRLCYLSYDPDVRECDNGLLTFIPEVESKQKKKQHERLDWFESEILNRIATDNGTDKVQVHCLNAEGHKNGDKHPSAFYHRSSGWYQCSGCEVRGFAKDRYKNIKDIRTKQEYEYTPEQHTVAASSIMPEYVEWIVPDLIPKAMLTLVTGKIGLGKSLLALHFVAKVSQEDKVLLYASEDDHSRIVIPRLKAADAYLDNITFVCCRVV